MKVPNRLSREKSPYLLQHANNPVDWYPWGDEAFDKAMREDRPIFLSIGYSTCHWCHVMERESFEDHEVARAMNDLFVPIKVDREERPDIDAVYMKACTLATGSGGWPLTVLMTPEKEPFFLGTYIPRKARWGSVGILDLIEHVKGLWDHDRGDVLRTAAGIRSALVSEGPGSTRDLALSDIEKAVAGLRGLYDEKNGGFGSRPKFPSPHQGLLLLRHWRRAGDPKALEMVTNTLDNMVRGGIRDHVGGGFHRYSTDAEWRLPHFEKMLYDQAMMSILLVEAFRATGKAEYGSALRSTLDYVLRDLSAPEGGFFSAEDADSEGEEGRFYLWTMGELRAILDGEELGMIDSVFDLKDDGNFRDEATGTRDGRNVLAMRKGSKGPGTDKGIEGVLEKLREARDRRTRPSLDDKVLADWNGLMISALARAYIALGDPGYIKRAEIASRFILDRMRGDGGMLLHRFRDGESSIPGFLDDHAFMVQGLLDLYEATLDEKYLLEAVGISGIAAREFIDPKGGFYQTSGSHEELFLRNKEAYDGAIPSGNSVMMMNLVRIARMTGDNSIEDLAEATGRAFGRDVSRSPSSYSYMLCALDMAIGPSTEIVISGDRNDPGTREMIAIARSGYRPNTSLILRDGPALDGIVRDLSEKVPLGGIPTAYVCSGNRCGVPMNDPAELIKALEM